MARIRVRAQPALTGQRRTSAYLAAKEAILTAQRYGWKATEGPNACWFVPSAHEPRTARCVQFTTGIDGTLWGYCSCPAGYWRAEAAEEPLPVPCWHVAAALAQLHAQGRVVSVDGLMTWRPPKDISA